MLLRLAKVDSLSMHICIYHVTILIAAFGKGTFIKTLAVKLGC